MIPDPIVDEIRAIRQKHAARYGNDLDRIVAALRNKEQKSTRPLLNPGPKRIHAQRALEDQEQYGAEGEDREHD